jgi:hypothetical protein
MKRFFGMVRPALEGSLPSRVLIAASVAVFTVVLSASGCNNEGEGERCDTNDDNNGDSDCASGLECKSAYGLPGAEGYGNETTSPTLGICCPTDQSQATTTVCAINPAPPNSNPGVPDAGSDAGGSGEAGSDASTDASADSANDAPLDSPSDALVDAPADSSVDATTDSPADATTD